jgi:hypothetical protein
MALTNFFRNSHEQLTDFFDEGPVVVQKAVTAVNSSSIETVQIDGFRQGVELTQIKHYDAGTYKIHAGEPGHVLHRNRYGMDKNFRPDPEFSELDYFDPVVFLELQEQDSPLVSNIITFPIITGDNDQIENFYFNGIIEPFPIREVASFFSTEVPFQARGVGGSISAGNMDQTDASDQILTVDDFSQVSQTEYIDMVDMFDGRIPMNGTFQHQKSLWKPFIDIRPVRNTVPSASYDTAMIAALSTMSGSSENYVTYKQRSATAGWTYGNTLGTDSITFGGRTY